MVATGKGIGTLTLTCIMHIMNDDILPYSELRADPANARIIKTKTFDNLKKTMKKYGDLSGFVLNQRTGLLVSGHQRTEAGRQFDGSKGIQITERFNPALKDGTVGVGRVVIDGQAFALRLVDWEPAFAHAAGLAANKISGEFDDDKVVELLYEIQQEDEALLQDTGFDDRELQKLLASAGVGDEPEPPEEPESNEMVFKLTADQSELVARAIDAVKLANDIPAKDAGTALYIMSGLYLQDHPTQVSDSDDLVSNL